MRLSKSLCIFLLTAVSFVSVTGCNSNTQETDSGKSNGLQFEIGDVITIDGEVQGIVFHLDSGKTSGKILSTERHKTKFCNTYVKACTADYASALVSSSSRTDGQYNYDIWCQILPDFEGNSYYDAWFWCKTIKGYDWYIPAVEELYEVNQNEMTLYDSCCWLKNNGYAVKAYDDFYTWSSTPRELVTDSTSSRMTMWTGDPTSSNLCNDNTENVQPVRTFSRDTPGLAILHRNPKFSKIEFPSVSCSRSGTTFTAKIAGESFKSSDFVLSEMKASCNKDSSIVSDAEFFQAGDGLLIASFKIPEKAGKYDITVSYRSESISGTLNVMDGVSYPAGSVVFNDGSIISYDEASLEFTEEQKQNAVGVIFSNNEYGVPLFVGLHNSADKSGYNNGSYAWTVTSTLAHKTTFPSILCTPDSTGSGAADSAAVTGDLNGWDNWDIIYAYRIGEAMAEDEFPAFYYIINYSSKYGITGDYSSGWYMPSLAELCDIYKNRTLINTVIESLGGTKVDDNTYWTSTKKTSPVWALRMSDGLINALGPHLISNSTYTLRVCCIQSIR